MITVKIYDKKPDDVIKLVKELKESGWVQSKDFDFSYTAPMFDSNHGEFTKRYAEFTFYTEKYATIFALKYS